MKRIAMDVKAVANVQGVQQINSQNVRFMETSEQVRIQREIKQQQKQQLEEAERLKKEKLTPEVMQEIIEELKKKLSMLNTQLKIQIDKDTDILVVKVINKETNEVIRQIPPEYLLKIAKYLDEITGLLYNEKV
jgi:flagellar protein FlaG